MSNLKVGDTVRVVDASGHATKWFKEGEIGVVTCVNVRGNVNVRIWAHIEDYYDCNDGSWFPRRFEKLEADQ